MDKHVFIQECQNQIRQVYQDIKNGQQDDLQKARVEGMLYAGQLLEVYTKEDARAWIEDIHLDIFGETVEQRKERKAARKVATETRDYDYFEAPAIERK